MNTKSPTIRSVGAKLIRSDSHSGVPVSIGWALMTTCSCSSSPSSESSANAGRSVWNLVDALLLVSGGLTAFLNSPWIVSPVEVTSETLPAVTCSRK
jgi:hypothetical protein